MAIPVYDSQRVAPQVAEGAKLNPGAGSMEGMASIGRGLGQVAEAMQQVDKMAQEQRGQEALNQLQQKKLEKESWITSLKGKQAFTPDAYGAVEGTQGSDLLSTALGWFDADAEEASKGLSGEALRLFKFGSSRIRLGFEEQVRNHEGREAGVVAKDTYEGVQAVENQNIAQNAIDPNGRIQVGVIAESLARKAYAANQYSAYAGEGADTRKARELAVTSDAHAIVLDSLLKRNNSQAAQAYFDLHRGQMDTKVVSAMEGKIQQSILATDVQTNADRIESMGLPLDQQDAEARKVFAKNPEGMKLLQSELEHRSAIRQHAQTVASQETTGKLWDMRFPTIPGQKQVPLTQIMRSQEWSSLNGTQRNTLISQWENYARRNENDPNLQVQRSLAYFNTITDPNFSSLTDNQIKALTPNLGPALTVQVMKDLHEIRTNPGKLQEMKLDHDVLEASAKKFGVIAGDKPTDAEKMNLAIMSAQAKQIMQASGQKWNYENQQKLYEQLSQQIVTDRGWLWDTKAPLFQVQTTTQVPQAFVDTVARKARALGQPVPSTAATYQLWFDAKGKGLVDEMGNLIAKPEATSEPGS